MPRTPRTPRLSNKNKRNRTRQRVQLLRARANHEEAVGHDLMQQDIVLEDNDGQMHIPFVQENVVIGEAEAQVDPDALIIQEEAINNHCGEEELMPANHHDEQEMMDVVVEAQPEVQAFRIGLLSQYCQFCRAFRFPKEKTNCCHSGKVQLPPLGEYPPEFLDLFQSNNATSKHFLQHIRKYNSSVSFASFVANGLCPVQNGGPYAFRLHGQVYHKLGTLHPPTGSTPSYAQLYIIEGDQAVESRMRTVPNQGCRREIMQILTTVLERVNPFAAAYKHMHQVEVEQQQIAEQTGQQVKEVTMHIKRGHDQRRYNEPRHDEVAAVFVSSDGAPPENPDVVIHPRDAPIASLHYMSSNIDPMTYPLFFPNGEYGWQPHQPHSELSTGQNTKVSCLQFYAYRLAVRPEHSPIFYGGKLFQQYVVDAYLRVESNNLNYIRTHQQQLRVECYSGLMDHIQRNADAAGAVPGKIVILPSSFQGSPRAMQQHYQDAMAIVAKFGKPDLFLTFTCNPRCADIKNALPEGQQAADRPDIVARVFHMHLQELIKDINKRHVLGKPIALIYVIEYQKRGLPHAHMLIILSEQDKMREPADVDRLISAEIPDPQTHPGLHKVVTTAMIHGPCGTLNKYSPCMADDKCTKDFPKQFQVSTVLAVNGYPLYKRSDNGRYVEARVPGGTVEVDNRWVVPYNPYLSTKFEAHINVEACTSVKSVKYLFKYVYKGHDCANIEVTERDEYEHDEVKTFLDARYVSAPEAYWRLTEKRMHYQSHSIVRLALHLPENQPVYFNANNVEEALAAAEHKQTTLTAFFEYNRVSQTDLTYQQFPQEYVFHKKLGEWKPRKRNSKIIGRVYSASPRDIERYCLRVLLHHVPGPVSYTDLRTVNGVTAASFKEACLMLNLLESDAEWDNALTEAAIFQMPSQLRQLFVTICKFCSPTDPKALWVAHRDSLIEDFLHAQRPYANVDAAEQLALHHIESLLQPEMSCADYGFYIDPELEVPTVVRDFDPIEEADIAARSIDMLNNEQREVVDSILQELMDMRAGADARCRAFFMDGPGGSGKTMCYNTIISWCRGNNVSVVASAWTGIAATLLKGGRTCHNLFKLPVPILETSVCHISPASQGAKHLLENDLFIIDEASMVPAHGLRAIDLMMQDITGIKVPFGGRVFLLGGDFRQVLPVVPKQGRTGVVENCLKRSPLWPLFRTVKLKQNMRAEPEEHAFVRWLLQLGNGSLTCNSDIQNAIELPEECNVVDNIVDAVFGSFIVNPRVSANTVILTPTNETTLTINNKVLNKKIPGPVREYLSADRVTCDNEEEAENYPMEFINSLTPSGLPQHRLRLKKGAVVMLLRNLNISKGLCNGTRLIVREMHAHTLDAEILTGASQGQRVLIPRIKLIPSDTNWPFTLSRTQFPVRLSYCMTINKAQGQTFDKLGIFLPQPVFSHGQLYVAFSRARSFSNIYVAVTQSATQGLQNKTTVTPNIVYKEVL